MGRTAAISRSPWVGIDPGVDPLKWAGLLRRAHRLALDRGGEPSILRPVVASSWRRATARGVDPDGHAPAKLDGEQTRRALARHPISHLLRKIEGALREATNDSRYLVALSDAEGMLLWVDGHPEALAVASEAGFEPGHLCSEGAVGTNAVGTALELSHPVQIFSAEHISRRLHRLTCSAAPIRDPETGLPLGALNLSGDFRTCHPHSLPLVSSVSRLVEETLARELDERDNRLRAVLIDRLGAGGKGCSAVVAASGRVVAAYPEGWLGARLALDGEGVPRVPPGIEATIEPIEASGGAFLLRSHSRRGRRREAAVRIEALSPSRVRVQRGDWQVDLSPRHSEIVMLLACHPEGLSGEELRSRLYASDCKPVTIRAEISRLRRLLGPVLLGNPYRLDAKVLNDPAELDRLLAGGRADEAREERGR